MGRACGHVPASLRRCRVKETSTLAAWRKDLAERIHRDAWVLECVARDVPRFRFLLGVVAYLRDEASSVARSSMRDPATWLACAQRRLGAPYATVRSLLQEPGSATGDLREVAADLFAVLCEIDELRTLLSTPTVCAGGTA